ncbi:MAG: HAMP domain-containing protein [Myxococcales bacterium]|nr:MAG: HAMP domain-containing protein [Myxococcales bacterium]
MRLVPKLALALFAGVFLVVAAFTALRARRDLEAFDADARRDQRIVGVTAGAAVSPQLTQRDAVWLAARVNDSREGIQIRFVSLAEGASPELGPLLQLAASERPRAGHPKQLVKSRQPGEEADYLVTYVGAPTVDDPYGAVELSQPLASGAAYAWQAFLSAMASSLAMVAVGGVTMAAIGARVVGRPVAELMGAARRIGEGEFDVLRASKRRDEFGELAGALRRMGSSLAEERRRTQHETDARIAALEQLRHAERLSTLGQLASVLAHEIGTPLNVVAGHAKLIAAGKLPGELIVDSARAIGAQCDRITGIVRRVLDYARRRPAKRTTVSGSDVLSSACGLLEGLAARRGVKLEIRRGPGDFSLWADPDQLQQCLTNVVSNAIYASPDGGVVQLSLNAVERSVAGERRPFLAFAVADTGHGLEEAVRARIFEPFVTTKPPGEGTGLGLSVARDIVAEHDGVIEVTSEPGHGCVFTIFVPRSSADVEPNPDR